MLKLAALETFCHSVESILFRARNRKCELCNSKCLALRNRTATFWKLQDLIFFIPIFSGVCSMFNTHVLKGLSISALLLRGI
jgi:hypothetical protein